MKINWKVRMKNKNFWVALVPALLLLIQAGAGIFGFTFDLGDLGSRLLTFVNTAFALLSLLGVVNDPTTQGLGDSDRAMAYDRPKEG